MQTPEPEAIFFLPLISHSFDPQKVGHDEKKKLKLRRYMYYYNRGI